MKAKVKVRAAQRGSRRQPERSRHAILQAALVEFAQEGLAGARMDAIAEAAGVNKALLYYYFRDKESLYGAVLDRFFARLLERVMAVCDRPGTAGERFLSYARAHFDSIAESPYYARIFMGELMSASRGGSPHLDRIFPRYMQPIAVRVIGLVQEGVNNGEFRPVHPNQFLPSTIGAIVHYFLTAPLRQKFMPEDFPSTEQSIRARRAAVLDFIAAALFTNRDAGIRLAANLATQDLNSLCEKPVRLSAKGDDLQNSNPEGVTQLSPAPFDDAQGRLRRRRSAGWARNFGGSPVGAAQSSDRTRKKSVKRRQSQPSVHGKRGRHK
ncbi:MAG: TetR/AcrR family transcriptional regulator [Candidatus Korobacteraceae bacterium]|jgi:TetR/AcrR family transcriptional regulator